MSSPFDGFNTEQVEAELQRLWAENPHKAEYDALSVRIKALMEERKKFAPKDAMAARLMLMTFGGKEDKETLSRMNNQQLCEFAMGHVWGNLPMDGIEEWTYDEMLKRLGYTYQGPEEE